MGKAVDYWKIMEQVCEAHPKGRPYKLDENHNFVEVKDA